jgi:aryl-alcohol dehydrogenase-like predicted oxidoreductase
MIQISLPNSSVKTSTIGLGAAYLVAGLERKRNRRLVDIAYESGFRHFDVAPIYGLGTAEVVLGEALRHRRHTSTIATKVGLPFGAASPSLLFAHAAYQPFRALNSYIPNRKVPSKGTTNARQVRFDLPFVAQSIVESLRALKTDYLDLLLLHEVQQGDVTDELITFLQKQRQAGVCISIGVASSANSVAQISRAWPKIFDVYQYSWSALDAQPTAPVSESFQITHRCLYRAFEPMRAWLRSSKTTQYRLSQAVALDLGSDAVLADVLVAAAIARNPGGIVLVASRKVDRIRRFCSVVQDSNLICAGNNLVAALEFENNRPLPLVQ